MAFDLTQPIGREALADKIAADIDEYCRTKYDDGPRKHLGASLTGHPCMMYLWLTFRWACEERFDGRMQRLFNRGHKEEARWIEWLRGTGWTVHPYALVPLYYHPESNSYFYSEEEQSDPLLNKILPEEPEYERHVALAILDGVQPPQIRINFAEGHGGGSLDAEASHSEYTAGLNFLGEFKTYNEKQFAKLKKDFMRKAKPQHWGQMCQYGFKRKIRYGIYFGICKNDDKTHVEVLELDWRLGEELLMKGEAVITSQQPPPRISDNPAWQDCKWCGKYRVCHLGEAVDKNCRSCRHAQPHKGGIWFCNLHGAAIPPEFISQGCKDHHAIIGPMVQ